MKTNKLPLMCFFLLLKLLPAVPRETTTAELNTTHKDTTETQTRVWRPP